MVITALSAERKITVTDVQIAIDSTFQLRSEILETDVNPLVYGELRVAGTSRTVLCYAHYDGQPFDPKLWKQESAFKGIMRDGRMEDVAEEIQKSGLTMMRAERQLDHNRESHTHKHRPN